MLKARVAGLVIALTAVTVVPAQAIVSAVASSGEQSVTSARWSIVLNGAVGTFSSPPALGNNESKTFTLTNAGTAKLKSMTLTVSATGNRDIWVCPGDVTCTEAASLETAIAGQSVVIENSTKVPGSHGDITTWTLRKTSNGGNATFTVDVSVTTSDLAD
jgi:hypothetical protein